MNLILLTLTVALCTEWVCLCCWTEFLAGVLVSAHPYCPDVVSARRQAVSQHLAGFQFADQPSEVPGAPPRACAQCCVSWSSCPLFTSLVTSEEVLKVSSVFLLVLWFRCSGSVLCSHAQIRKPFHQNMKLPCEMCSFHWKGLSVWSSSAGLPFLTQAGQVLIKETVTKPDDPPCQNQFRRLKGWPSFPCLWPLLGQLPSTS